MPRPGSTGGISQGKRYVRWRMSKERTIRLQIASITDIEDRSRARPIAPTFCGGSSVPKQILRSNRRQCPRLHYYTSPPRPTARLCLTRLAYGFPPAEAPDRGSVFTLTIRLRGSDGSGLSESARCLLELVRSCDSIGEAEGEAGGPECAQAGEAFSLMSTGGALSQSGAIISRLLRTHKQNQKEPEDWAVCSDAPQSLRVCTKGSARRGGAGDMVDSAVLYGCKRPCRILSPRCRMSERDERVLPGALEVHGRAPPRAGSADGAGDKIALQAWLREK
jgi:hypothetical protein